jgi:dihydroorotate dehydrogenase electron transfer subunit
MLHLSTTVVGLDRLHDSIYCLTIRAPEIVGKVFAGQFVNIQISPENVPLLRRPFSVYNILGDDLLILFNTVGQGTTLLSKKKKNDAIDLIGPLGNFFDVDDQFSTGLLVGGGMGVASLPLLNSVLKEKNIPTISFIGARDQNHLILNFVDNINCATDDGSKGFKGNVVSLLDQFINLEKPANPKIFACGPPRMLNSIADLAWRYSIPCEVSVESVMACGVGICQGCPIERSGTSNKYSLVCKDGPVYDSRTLKFIHHG